MGAWFSFWLCISNLEQSLSNLLDKQLGEKLIAERLKNMEKNHTLQIDVSLKIIDGLQYLKEYSVGKFLKKKSKHSKNYKKEEHQFNITILQ